MEKRTIYLDTNILSRIPDLRVSTETAAALATLAGMGRACFVTSWKTKQEILRTTSQQRSSMLQFLCALIEKVKTVPVYYSGAVGTTPLGVAPVAGDWTHPKYALLKKIFDSDDAEHIVQALEARCDYFMTLDEKTILKPAEEHQSSVRAICGTMKLLSPIDVVREFMQPPIV